MIESPSMAGQSDHRWPVSKDPVYLCWLWTGPLDKDGYGKHREVYEAEVGPVEDGHVLDHRCRRRHCCNPMHLDSVSQSTNEKRKSWKHRTKLKTCTRGHDRYLHGRRTPEGGHICLLCG